MSLYPVALGADQLQRQRQLCQDDQSRDSLCNRPLEVFDVLATVPPPPFRGHVFLDSVIKSILKQYLLKEVSLEK